MCWNNFLLLFAFGFSYHYLSNTIDSISGHSMHLRNLLCLPEKETEDKLEDSSRELFIIITYLALPSTDVNVFSTFRPTYVSTPLHSPLL